MLERRTKHRGLALLQVMAVVALSAVLGMAMLAESSMQMQTIRNQEDIARAEALAESGVNMAVYYLDNPNNAPSLNADGHWAGGNDIYIGTGMGGKLNVSIALSGYNTFDVTSVGVMSGGVQRRIRATVKVNKGLPIKHAIYFGAGGTLYTHTSPVDGNLLSVGTFKLNSLTQVKYNVYSDKPVTNAGRVDGTIYQVNGHTLAVPTEASVRDYTTYWYNGVKYNATRITSSSPAAGTKFEATDTNPAAVYYYYGDPASPGTFTLNSNVEVRGTLIVRHATLVVAGSGIRVEAKDGFPAVVAYGDVRLAGLLRAAEFRGLTWVGGNITSALTTTGTITTEGALMLAKGQVASTYLGKVAPKFNSSRVDKLLDIDTRYPVGSPQILSWTKQ